MELCWQGKTTEGLPIQVEAAEYEGLLVSASRFNCYSYDSSCSYLLLVRWQSDASTCSMYVCGCMYAAVSRPLDAVYRGNSGIPCVIIALGLMRNITILNLPPGSILSPIAVFALRIWLPRISRTGLYPWNQQETTGMMRLNTTLIHNTVCHLQISTSTTNLHILLSLTQCYGKVQIMPLDAFHDLQSISSLICILQPITHRNAMSYRLLFVICRQ